MIRHGIAPYTECSTRGLLCLSAFHARPRCLHGRSIEEAYQAMKVLRDGRTGLTWREAKGKAAINITACALAFDSWWFDYIHEYKYQFLLLHASGLSDLFGQPGHTCTATSLWNLRETLLA